MSKKLFSAMLAIGLFALMFTSISAAVNYDPETGGYAGKGDVQNALGLKNNGAFQAAAPNIQFRFSDNVVVEGGACLFTEGNNAGDPHPNDVWSRTTGVSAALDFEAKNQKQVSGFNLAAIDGGSGDPVYTDSCGGNRVPDEGQILDTLPGDGLEVSLNGTDWFPLPNTP